MSLFQAFTVDVWVSGIHHVIEKRYSEFEKLHQMVSSMSLMLPLCYCCYQYEWDGPFHAFVLILFYVMLSCVYLRTFLCGSCDLVH